MSRTALANVQMFDSYAEDRAECCGVEVEGSLSNTGRVVIRVRRRIGDAAIWGGFTAALTIVVALSVVVLLHWLRYVRAEPVGAIGIFLGTCVFGSFLVLSIPALYLAMLGAWKVSTTRLIVCDRINDVLTLRHVPFLGMTVPLHDIVGLAIMRRGIGNSRMDVLSFVLAGQKHAVEIKCDTTTAIGRLKELQEILCSRLGLGSVDTSGSGRNVKILMR